MCFLNSTWCTTSIHLEVMEKVSEKWTCVAIICIYGESQKVHNWVIMLQCHGVWLESALAIPGLHPLLLTPNKTPWPDLSNRVYPMLQHLAISWFSHAFAWKWLKPPNVCFHVFPPMEKIVELGGTSFSDKAILNHWTWKPRGQV